MFQYSKEMLHVSIYMHARNCMVMQLEANLVPPVL